MKWQLASDKYSGMKVSVNSNDSPEVFNAVVDKLIVRLIMGGDRSKENWFGSLAKSASNFGKVVNRKGQKLIQLLAQSVRRVLPAQLAEIIFETLSTQFKR